MSGRPLALPVCRFATDATSPEAPDALALGAWLEVVPTVPRQL